MVGFIPRVLNKFASNKSIRLLRWYKINRAFNPQDPWRIRPRKYVSSPMSPEVGQILNKRLSVDAPTFTDKKTLSPHKFVTTNPLWNYPSQTACKVYYPKHRRVSTWFRLIFSSIGFFKTLKLKYKGKSFRWHRKARSILLRFGHSHLVFAKPRPGVFWRKHGRQKIIFWGSNKWYLWRFLKNTVAWRPMNIYHGRGLRITKQKVWRKAGKVSAYR